MPVTWTVKELSSPETALPDGFLVVGLLFRRDPREEEVPTRESTPRRERTTGIASFPKRFIGPVLRDVDDAERFAPIVDQALVRAIESEEWPFREGARFLFRCEVRRALDSVEIDEVEEIAVDFSLRDPGTWVSLSWPP